MIFDPIPIRYEGMDANQREIDLALLGQSLQGAARLLGVLGHYAYTQQYAKKMPALSVRVLAQVPRPGSYEVAAHIITTGPLVMPLLSMRGVTIVEHLAKYVLAKLSDRNTTAEKAIALAEAAVKEQGAVSKEAIGALRSVAEKLADNQRPAARLFVSPVGTTCDTVKLGRDEIEPLQIDGSMREIIDRGPPRGSKQRKDIFGIDQRTRPTNEKLQGINPR